MDWHMATVDLNEKITPQSCAVKTNRKKVETNEIVDRKHLSRANRS